MCCITGHAIDQVLKRQGLLTAAAGAAVSAAAFGLAAETADAKQRVAQSRQEARCSRPRGVRPPCRRRSTLTTQRPARET